MRFSLKKSAAVLLLMCSMIGHAEYDFQWWNNVTLQGPISGQFRYWLEGQTRFGVDLTRLSQSIVRPGLGYQINKENSIWAGYAWIYTTKPFASPANDENRLWQQYIYFTSKEKMKFMSRTRLEQRWVEGVPNVGWRFRQFFKLMRSVSSNDRFFLSATNEVFARINNVSINGDNRGFDQNRFFLGLSTYFTKSWLFEVGYQNHYLKRESGANFKGDYVAVNLFGTF